MNGFDRAELRKPGLLARLFGRKLKDNAIREIQNVLANRSLDSIAAADIEHILSEYLLRRDEAAEGLNHLYRTALHHRAKDGLLSDIDVGEMRRLRYILGLDDKVAKDTEVEMLREMYRAMLKEALTDSSL